MVPTRRTDGEETNKFRAIGWKRNNFNKNVLIGKFSEIRKK